MVKDFDDSEYLSKLQTKLLEAIRSQIPKEHFNWWFDEKLSIEDISEDNRITFGADSELSTAWLQLRYSDMLKKTLRSITNENVDFELSFVVREAIADIIVEKKDTAFDFLFEDKNNEYNEEYKEHIEGKSLEEIWELAYGKEDLEEQKVLYQKRILQADYSESEVNIVQCVMCGCDDVPNKVLEVPVGIRGIVSVSVKGAKCTQCAETYYDSNDTQAIREFKKLLNNLFPNT